LLLSGASYYLRLNYGTTTVLLLIMSTRAAVSSLEDEAAGLSPLLGEINNLYLAGGIADHDFVGVFILAYAAYRRPKNKWSCGRLKPCVTDSALLGETTRSIKVVEIPKLLEMLNQKHLEKLFGSQIDILDLTIVDIFNHVKLTGIKKNNDNMTNKAIVNWALRMWPFKLLTYIPTPMEVLRMQASRCRVITLFYNECDLASVHEAKLTYMTGSKVAAKDAFDFLIHDITHMEHFIAADSHLEQVGLMQSLVNIRQGSPRKLFRWMFPGDNYLWLELEYLISDM
jgi:hypothetical protein